MGKTPYRCHDPMVPNVVPNSTPMTCDDGNTRSEAVVFSQVTRLHVITRMAG